MHLFFLFVTKTSLLPTESAESREEGLPKYNIAARIRFNGWRQLGDRRSENFFWSTIKFGEINLLTCNLSSIQVYAHKDTLTFDTMA